MRANAVWPVVWGVCFIAGVIIGCTGPVRVPTSGSSLPKPHLRGSERAAQKPSKPKSTAEIQAPRARHGDSEGFAITDLKIEQHGGDAAAETYGDAAVVTGEANHDAVAAAAAAAAFAPAVTTVHNDAVGAAAAAAAAAASASAASASAASAAAAHPSTALTVHRALGLSDFAKDFPDEQFEVYARGFGGLWGPDEEEGKEISKEMALLRQEVFMPLHAQSSH